MLLPCTLQLLPLSLPGRNTRYGYLGCALQHTQLIMPAMVPIILFLQISKGFLFGFFQDCPLLFSHEAALDIPNPLYMALFFLTLEFERSIIFNLFIILFIVYYLSSFTRKHNSMRVDIFVVDCHSQG